MDLLKPPRNCLDFDTPNREDNIEDICSDVILGRGAYGVVLRASYKKRNVAVKILEKSSATKYESLKREANVLNLFHRNIVRILKIVESKTSTYGAVIMERFDGRSLQEVLDHHKIDLIHRFHILSDIASALVCCHKHGIIHSDLKPQNVLVAVNVQTNNGRAYLCKLFDFGCSLKSSDELDESYVGGTVRYCAPELLQNLAPDTSADIFSFAIVMWQMKENKIPYSSIQANETIIWNVVKNNMRPDSSELNLPSYQTPIAKKSRRAFETIQCKSDSSFLQVKKSGNLTVTPKSNQIVNKRKLFVSKESLGGVSWNKKFFIRQKLFESSLSPDCDGEDENEEPSSENMFRDLFVDRKLRSPEQIQLVERQYVSMYKSCWSSDRERRFDALKAFDTLQTFINLL